MTSNFALNHSKLKKTGKAFTVSQVRALYIYIYMHISGVHFNVYDHNLKKNTTDDENVHNL